MNKICKIFPLIGNIVLTNLDYTSLFRARTINKQVSEFINGEKLFWNRVIGSYSEYFEGFEESWNEVIKTTPVVLLKELALVTHLFFQSYSFKGPFKYYVSKQGGWEGHFKCLLKYFTRQVGG